MVKTLLVEEPTYWNIKDAQTILEKKGIKYTLPEMLDIVIPSIEDMVNKIEEEEENKLKKDIQKIKEERINNLIKLGLTKDDVLIEMHYGFPIIQLTKHQKGKCYNKDYNKKDCNNDLDVPEKESSLEDYKHLSNQAIKLDDIIDDYNIIGHDHGYRLFCQKCSGI